MKNKKRIGIATAAVAILVMVGAFAFAQKGNGDGYGRNDGRGRGYQDRPDQRGNFDGLDLTDEQKSKVEELRLSSVKANLPIQNQIREKEAHLTTLVTAEKANTTDIDNTIEAIGKLKTEVRINHTNTQLAIRGLLTDNQKIIFDQHLANQGGRGNQMGRDRGQNCRN